MTCKLNRLVENLVENLEENLGENLEEKLGGVSFPAAPEISRVVSIRQSACRLTYSAGRIKENPAVLETLSATACSRNVWPIRDGELAELGYRWNNGGPPHPPCSHIFNRLNEVTSLDAVSRVTRHPSFPRNAHELIIRTL